MLFAVSGKMILRASISVFGALLFIALLMPAPTAHADDPKCRADERARAAANYAETLAAASSVEGKELADVATQLFATLPKDLQRVGQEYLFARTVFESIDSARNLIQAQRMALMADVPGESFPQKRLHEERYRKTMALEMALDGPDYEADRAYNKAKTRLDQLATEFARQCELRTRFDRAFSWDDHTRELRLCMAPRSNHFLLDNRLCATTKPGSDEIRYSLHRFASYADREPIQSDQALIFDLGLITPAEYVKTKDHRTTLFDALLADRLLGLCR